MLSKSSNILFHLRTHLSFKCWFLAPWWPWPKARKWTFEKKKNGNYVIMVCTLWIFKKNPDSRGAMVGYVLKRHSLHWLLYWLSEDPGREFTQKFTQDYDRIGSISATRHFNQSFRIVVIIAPSITSICHIRNPFWLLISPITLQYNNNMCYLAAEQPSNSIANIFHRLYFASNINTLSMDCK